MKKKLFVLLATCLLLTGCGHKGDDIATRKFEVSLLDNKLVQLDIPADWTVAEQDGFSYWKFDNASEICRTKTPVVTGDLKDNCWYTPTSVSRNFDDYTVTIKTNKKMVDTVGEMLNKVDVSSRDVAQYKERGLDKLPSYDDYGMDFTTNGLYMPLDYSEVQSDAFTACNSINGSSFVTCWIMNYKLADLKPVLNNLVTCNQGGKLSKWYEASDIYYAEAGNYVVAAKKLTYNKWCCYLSSNDSYANYVRKAVVNVKSND